MSILTGPQILIEIEVGRIKIEPFRSEAEGPNSVNLRLGRTLLRYTDLSLDMKRECPTESFEIPEEGILLHPGQLYLGHTEEYTETPYYIPEIDGRSSVARLGLSIHLTAGRGDCSFCGQWTLEITVTKSIRVYAGVEICQITYHTPFGQIRPYKGKYANSLGPKPSQLWRDFLPKEK